METVNSVSDMVGLLFCDTGRAHRGLTARHKNPPQSGAELAKRWSSERPKASARGKRPWQLYRPGGRSSMPVGSPPGGGNSKVGRLGHALPRRHRGKRDTQQGGPESKNGEPFSSLSPRTPPGRRDSGNLPGTRGHRISKLASFAPR